MMMKHKKTSGMTLVEMLLSLALLAIVMAAAGSAVASASQSYALTKKMQDDEYNARMALLSITREVHRGVDSIDAAGDVLTLTSYDGATDIIYYLDADNTLKRDVSGSDTPVPFTEVELADFTATIDTSNPRWLELEVEGTYGLVLKTKVAIFRVPPTSP